MEIHRSTRARGRGGRTVEAGAAVFDVDPNDDLFAAQAQAQRCSDRDAAAAALAAIAARRIARSTPAVLHPTS